MLPFRRLGAAPLRGPMRIVSAAAPSRSLLVRNHSLPVKCVFSVSNEWLSATPWRLPLVTPFVPLARRFVTVATAAFSHNGALLPDNKPRNTRVLIFDVEGNPTTQTMTRAEVLRITREAAASTLEDAASAPTPPPRVRTPRGARSNSDGIIDVQRVHARDIRQLDSAFAVRSEPSVEVRDQAILVNADPIRAIIMRHRCVVFLREDDLTLQPMLEDVFHTAAAPDEAIVAYEFQALEALLGALCRYYHGEFNRVAPAITTSLFSLSRLTAGQPTAGELDTLRSFKNTMNEFQSRVDGVRRALMATLNNEEDLRLLYLSKLHEDRSLLGNVWSYDSEEAEVFIENYLQEIYALQTNATLMQQRIQNTETVVKLRLDAMRNYLLGTNILFSVAGISISLGTFVAGVFGMNLVSGVEEAHGWFLAVTSSSVVLMGVSGWVTVRFFKRKGIFGSIQQVKSLTDKKRVTSDSPVKKTDTA